MDVTQTSITRRSGVTLPARNAGLAGYLAIASWVTAASRQPGTRMRQSASTGRRPVAPIADRITDLVVLELIAGAHPGGPR